jgi:hypothetical protein
MAIPGAPPVQDVASMRKQFFQGRREEAQRGVNAQGQEQNDAIQRRFTAMGAANTGANIAAMQKANEGQADAMRLANRDVDQGELQSLMASQEAKEGRDYARSMFDVDQGNKLKQLDLAERNFGLEKEAQEFNMRMAEIEAGREAPQGMLDKLGSNLGKGLGGVANAAKSANRTWMSGGLNQIPGVGDAVNSVANAVGTLICTELNRQGILNDEMFKLDGKFGKDFAKSNSNVFRGYLLFARPIVRQMQKSSLVTKIVAKIFMPWCQWMASQYDSSYKTSIRGAITHQILIRAILPTIFYANKIKNFFTQESVWQE